MVMCISALDIWPAVNPVSGIRLDIRPAGYPGYPRPHLTQSTVFLVGSAKLRGGSQRLYQSLFQEREASEELPLQPARRQQKPGLSTNLLVFKI